MLNSSSPRAEQSSVITLLPHQLACISKMYEVEALFRSRINRDISYKSSALTLPSGMGKTNVILEIIKRKPCVMGPLAFDLHTTNEVIDYGEYVMMGEVQYTYCATTIIVIQSPSYKFWETKLREYRFLFSVIRTARHVQNLDMHTFDDNEILLVTAPQFAKVAEFANTYKIAVSRIVYDNFDTLLVPSRSDTVRSCFVWYVSAYYTSASWSAFFEHIHEASWPFVISCTDEFIDESAKLRDIICEDLYYSNISTIEYIQTEVKPTMIDQDMVPVIDRLNITNESTLEQIKSLIIGGEAIIASNRDSSAVKPIVDRLNSLNVSEDECCICMDTVTRPMLLVCCHKLTCSSCILRCIGAGRNQCPLCRFSLSKSLDLYQETLLFISNEVLLKRDYIIDLLIGYVKSYKNSRYIVFGDGVLNESLMRQFDAIITDNKTKDTYTAMKFSRGKINSLYVNIGRSPRHAVYEKVTHIIDIADYKYHNRMKYILGSIKRIGQSNEIQFVSIHKL